MNLARWQIVFAKENDLDTVGHPAVILSGEDILSDPRQLRFNVLMGTKKPPAAKALEHQVVLDRADGLEYQTLINCAMVYVVRKTSILRDAGVVCHQRRADISRRVRASLGVY